MPPQEQNEKRTSDPYIGEPQSVEQNVPAGKYSLESIMALQKALEDGIPDNTAHEATLLAERPIVVSDKQPQTPFLHEFFSEIVNDFRDLGQRLHLLMLRARKSKAADKGNSARHTG